MNNDLISREDLKKAVEKEQAQYKLNTESDAAKWDECDRILFMIEILPAVDKGYQEGHIDGMLQAEKLYARPVGEWIIDKNTRDIICSCCGQSRRDTRANHIFFCNHCGAKMEAVHGMEKRTSAQP